MLVRGGTASAASTTLSVLSGRVEEAKADRDFAAAVDGDVLLDGDRVRTAEDGHALLTFFDASTIEVEPSTNIVVQSAKPAGDAIDIRITQTVGRTWSSVQKLGHPASKYEVHTPSAVAAVRGTGMEVVVLPNGGTTVKLTDGFAVVTANGESVTVNAGQQSTTPPGAAPGPVVPIAQPPSTLRFGMHSPAYIAVVDVRGRACGVVLPGPTVVRQIPGCLATAPGIEPQIVDVPGASPGEYKVAIYGKGEGPFTLTATGVSGDKVTFNDVQTGNVKPGDQLASAITVQGAPDGSLRSAGLTAPVLVASVPVKAVIPSPSPAILPFLQNQVTFTLSSGAPPTDLFKPLPSIGFEPGPQISSQPLVQQSPSAAPAPSTAPPSSAPPSSAPPSSAPPSSAPPSSAPPSSAPPSSPPPSPIPTPSLPPSLVPSSTPLVPSPIPTAPSSLSPLPTIALPSPSITPVATPQPTVTQKPAAGTPFPFSTPFRFSTPFPFTTTLPTPAPSHTPTPTPVPTPTPTSTPTSTPAGPTPTPPPAGSPGVPGGGAGVATNQGGATCGGLPICGPDLFGYLSRDDRASGGPQAYWLDLAGSATATRLHVLDDQDDHVTQVTIPFRFPYYGRSYDQVFPETNGVLGIGGGTSSYSNSDLPVPNLVSRSYQTGGWIFGYWDDLITQCNLLTTCGVWYQTGSFSNGSTTIQYAAFEWSHVSRCCYSNDDYSFEIVIYSDGRVDLNYRTLQGAGDSDATIGIQDRFGASYIQISSRNNPSALEGRTIRFYPSGVTDNTRPGALTAATIPASQPLPPTGLTAVDVPSDGGGAVDLSWTASSSSGVTAYHVYGAIAHSEDQMSLLGTVGSGVTTFRASGLIHGDEYAFTVRAWNGTRESFNSTVAVVANTSNDVLPPSVYSANIGDGSVGVPYLPGGQDGRIILADAVEPIQWSVSSGQLPLGLAFEGVASSAYGYIRGTPLQAGTSAFTLMAVDATGRSVTQSFSITINGTWSALRSTITSDVASAPANGTSTINVTVTLRDASGASVAGLPVELLVYSGDNVSSSAQPVTSNASGVATFAIATTNAGDRMMRARVEGAGVFMSWLPLTFTPASGNSLAVIVPVNPTGQLALGAGQTFNASVEVRGSSGWRVPTSGSVSLALTGGAPSAVLSGTTTAAVNDGIAYFSGLSISAAGTGYQLVASMSGFTPASSGTMAVLADASAPAAPVITTPINGALSGASIALTGTAEPSSTVVLFGNNTQITGSIVVSAGGGWTYTYSATPGRSVTFVAFAADAAGNLGTSSLPVTVHAGGLTILNNSNQVISTAAPGQQVTINGTFFPEGASVAATIGAGSLSFTPATVDATRSFSVTTTVAANATAGDTLTVTAGGVSATKLSFVQNAALSLNTQGNVGNTESVNGTGWPVGAAVTLQWNGSPLATSPSIVTVSATGTWQANYTVPTTQAGSYSITASAGARSVVQTYSVRPVVMLTTGTGGYNDTIGVSGTGFAANTAVTVSFDGSANLVGSVTTDANGSFSGASFTRPLVNRVVGDSHIVRTTTGTVVKDTNFSPTEFFNTNNSLSSGYNITGYATELEIISASGFSGSGSASVFFCSGTATATTTCTTNALAQYSFTMTNGAGSVGVTVPNVPGGSYTIIVTDPNGNSARTDLTIRSYSMSVTPNPVARSNLTQPTLTISGVGFIAGTTVTFDFCTGSDGVSTCNTLATLSTVTVAGDGSFTGQFVLPTLTNLTVEIHQVRAFASSRTAQTGLTVQPPGF